MVNFGIIGCGKIGIRHIDFLREMDGVRVLAVCDIIPERARQIARQINTDFFTNYKDLLKIQQIDIVNICTPNGLHAQISVDALNADKHVLCEKPMCLKVDRKSVV